MFSIKELLDFLVENRYLTEAPFYKDEIQIEKLSSLTFPKEGSLCWTKKQLGVKDIPDCAVLICLPEQEENPQLNTLLIHVKEPRKVFGAIVEKFCPKKEITGISTTAEIPPSVKIGKEVYIGPKCVIGEHCEIGDNTRLDANVTIYDHVIIGKRCHISSGAVIGADGHGYYLDDNKRYKKIRHVGGVSIGDDVDIGANACIDRGVLDDTVIGNNTKIDNLVQIAHNVRIGINTTVAAGSILAGSVVLGDNCWIAPGAVVKNGVCLNNEVQVGMNSVVYRTTDKSNICLVGDPAKIIKEYKIK